MSTSFIGSFADSDNRPDFSTDSSFKDVFDQQKDRNGNVLSEGNTLPPQLQKVFTRYDSSLDVVKNSKCKK